MHRAQISSPSPASGATMDIVTTARTTGATATLRGRTMDTAVTVGRTMEAATVMAGRA